MKVKYFDVKGLRVSEDDFRKVFGPFEVFGSGPGDQDDIPGLSNVQVSRLYDSGEPSHVTTTVELADSAIRMIVEDNGIGFRPPKLTDDLRAEDGLGLIGMHERVRLLGGNLAIDSELGRGTRVVADVPI